MSSITLLGLGGGGGGAAFLRGRGAQTSADPDATHPVARRSGHLNRRCVRWVLCLCAFGFCVYCLAVLFSFVFVKNSLPSPPVSSGVYSVICICE